MNNIANLYIDYLQLSNGLTTATGLSNILDNNISHDQITRMLKNISHGSKELWKEVKPLVRKYESNDGCLIFDDSIIHKPYTDENDIVCWHYDHCQNQNVKGINILTTFYNVEYDGQSIRIPIAYDIVNKPLQCDIETKKEQRKSSVTKNEQMQSQIKIAIINQVTFTYILADSWFSSNANMRFIDSQGKIFIFDIKSNRKATIGDRNKGNWKSIKELDILEYTPTNVWLKDLEIEVLIFKQTFKNKDGSTGVRYLVSNDLNLTREDFINIYKKRWSIEEYHKSLKQNTSIEKSPTKVVNTQSSHIFLSIMAYIKFEKYKLCTKLNHFALKSKLYINAIKGAFKELNKFKEQYEIS